MTEEQIISIVKKATVESLQEYFDESRTVSISEAARILNHHRATIYRMIERGQLKKIGEQVSLNSIRRHQHQIS